MSPLKEFKKKWAFAVEITPVGSRVTCSPPPMDTDEDYLVYVSELSWTLCHNWLTDAGWSLDGSRVTPVFEDDAAKATQFASFKHGDVNLILTPSRVFYGRFLAASGVCKRLNLLEKSDRIAVFQAVLYGLAIEAAPLPKGHEMDVQIRPLETLYCFGYDKPECSSCANRQTWERLRTTNHINQSAAPIDFTQCDLTALTHRVEVAA